MSTPGGTNARVTASALLLLLAVLPFRELIPVREGEGYDGYHYVRWTQVLSVEALWSIQRERPEGVTLTSYHVRRALVPMTLHYLLLGLGVPPDRENVLVAWTATNILMIALTVLLFCRSADVLGLGDRAKWFGLVALVVSYASWKMPIFYPALTDSSAMALGAAMLHAWLRGRWLMLALATFAGAFVWPSLPYFGFLLLAFPRAEDTPLLPAPRALNRLGAAAAAAAALAVIVWLVVSGYEIESTRVRPVPLLVPVSALLVAGYLYLALAPLLDSRALWQDARPWRLVARPLFWLAILVHLASNAVVDSVPSLAGRMTGLRALQDTFASAITQPGIFFVAHALFFGPAVLLLLFFWRPISESVRRSGTGLVLCFVLALVLGAGSESRKLMNFYPAIVLFLAQAVEPALTPRRLAWLAALSLLFSKVWLRMSVPLELPGLGELSWNELFDSSRGPWIDHGWWAAQTVIVLAVAVWLHRWTRPL